MIDRTLLFLALGLAFFLAGGWFLPYWAQSLIVLAFGKGMVVLGLVLLMRMGLVSFGQGLYYCLGAYAAVSVGRIFKLPDSILMSDAIVMPLFGAVIAGTLAFVLGFLLARYRAIFFAMLSLAFSMILYGLLIKMSVLGSSDGFNISYKTVAGIAVPQRLQPYSLYAVSAVMVFLSALGLHRYLQSHLGRLAPAIRDNELRVEYMGASVRYVVHLNYVIAGALGGLGGALVALSIGHIDPDLAYWTTSGEFVFVAILGGTANVMAPFVGSLLFEWVKSVAYQYSPYTWQMVLGIALLLIIMFLPAGLWSVFKRKAA
ncbi:MAG TPA: branched-chain amino acid ABC transporter permease [Candidatus Binataceae bacterium]|nr:branched-chain amino acid ABC transporter permease [Candidatus Binataceae bacterium]